MRKLLVLALVLGLAGMASANQLGIQAPTKAEYVGPVNVPNPGLQGGDTVLNATPIASVPYSDSGTTAGYNNDYDEVCPYTGSTSPDVVYSLVAPDIDGIVVDLCGSSYDTKVYVYDSGLNLVACNDDFYFDDTCGVYASKIEQAAVTPGETYYIVVDGYGTAFGDYMIEVTEYVPCVLDCPAGGFAEDEPSLMNDYVDNYNGGCNTPPAYPFQSLTADAVGELTLCGTTGWYLFQGSQYRDTDWFILTAGGSGNIEITIDAELPVLAFELTQDCDFVEVIQQTTAGPCAEGFMTIGGYSQLDPVWFWVGPPGFEPPTNPFEFDYIVRFSGLEPGTVATQDATWSSVKALYQ